MTGYYLFFLDKAGHFMRRQQIEVESDEAAIQCAYDLDHAPGIEIWCGKRKVALIHPEPKGTD